MLSPPTPNSFIVASYFKPDPAAAIHQYFIRNSCTEQIFEYIPNTTQPTIVVTTTPMATVTAAATTTKTTCTSEILRSCDDDDDWCWLMFYGHFCAQGRLPKVMRRSERRNNLQICPRRNSNTGGSDLWSSTLPLDHGGAHSKLSC